MLLEGILSIQAGDNPRMLAEKLETFIEPGARGDDEPATRTAPTPQPTVTAEAAEAA
jgi:flagellar motor component MotA